MARIEEPVFCSPNLTSLLARFPLEPSSQDGATFAPPDALDLIEDNESEDGGVSLFNDDVDQQMTDAFASTNLTGQAAPPTVLGTSHPRPQSLDSCDEEDGRRVRFALDGEDTSDVPQFAPRTVDDTTMSNRASNIPSSGADLSAGAIAMLNAPMSAHDEQGETELTRSSTSQEHANHAASPLGAQVMSGTPPAPVLERHPTHESFLEHAVSDNYMDVDDPRWNYDMADFMDSWRFQSLVDESTPTFEPGIQPSVRIGRHLKEVRPQDCATREVDMQGLYWQMLGPSREAALAARVLLHPSMRTQAMKCADGVPVTPAVDAAQAYRFRNFATKHRAQLSHYQLRNNLAAHSRSDIFYANGSTVERASLASAITQDTVVDLSRSSSSAARFRITCLAASSAHRLVLAGGFCGEYALLSNGSGRPVSELSEGFVTHAYNGLVTHIHCFDDRRSGLPQAAFCSNDRQLRLFDVGTTRFTDSFAYPYPVNCSATSPEGRLRVLVGDCNEAHVTDATNGSVVATLSGHTDHGFACAWAPNGFHFATGAQDGKTLVWDARNWSQPLHSLPSVMSCPRSLQFKDNDSLVVAEDQDVVSVFDAGTFHRRQDIRFFGSIAGVTLLRGGEELVVANVDRTVGGLMSFDQTAVGADGEHSLYKAPTQSRRKQGWRNMPGRSPDLLTHVMI